ncbi:hypothetical protein PspLS_08340 [Pyricularia sp. CBS 133598]|nr:hypothetical protein PspLS_08340 [Pyricularia sp. CBS 133598]
MQTCQLILLFVLPLPILGWNQISGGDLEKALGSDEPKLIAYLEEEWLQAASEAPESILAVDCSNNENKNFCASHAGDTYPSVRLFQAASPGSIYQGSKAAKARPLVSELTTPEEYSALLTADEAVFIAYAPTPEHLALIQDVAARYRNEFTFGLVADPALIPGEPTGTTPSPFVLCHRSEDAATSRLPLVKDSSTTSPKDLAAFIEEASRPTIAELTARTHARCLARGAPIVYIFARTAAERALLRASLHRLATGYRDSLTIVTVDPAEFPDLPSKLGLGGTAGEEVVEGRPAGALHQLSKDRVYPYPRGRPVDPRSIQQWGLDVFQGRVRPWTPPGVTTSYDDLGPTRVAAAATRKISIANIPGLKIKIAGHRQDEL